MDNNRAYRNANADFVEMFSCINKHDPRNWENSEYNRDEGWSESNDEFVDMELDSFSGSESGSKRFEFHKAIDQEETTVCNCVCSGIRPRLPETLSQPLSNLIQQCWHQVPGERPTCGTILQTLGTLSFPDNWKALLGTSTNTNAKHEESRGTSKLGNDEKLKVIAEDTELIENRKLDNKVSNSPKTIENNVSLDELVESPRAPLYSRSMSAPIPTPPPPPPMPKPYSIFTVPNIVTPDPGKRSGLVDSSGGVYGFGITTEEIQRQKKLLKSRISDESSSYLNGSSSNSDDLTSVLKRVLDKRRECRSDDEDDISEQNSLASRKEPKEISKNKRTKNRRRRSLSQSSSRDSPSTNSCWSTSDEL